MSIDYEFYLDTPFPEPLLANIEFVEKSRNEKLIRGTSHGKRLSVVLLKEPAEDSFTREELRFAPACQILLSPDIERYDESMDALIDFINCSIPYATKVKVYLNNELLLLSKDENQTLLLTTGNDWWAKYIEHINFQYVTGSPTSYFMATTTAFPLILLASLMQKTTCETR